MLVKPQYPFISPYVFSNSNPIIYKDDDGRDYKLVIDHDTKQIIVVQNFYTVSEKSYAQLTSAISELNNLTREVVVDGETYTMSFQVNVMKPNYEKTVNSESEIVLAYSNASNEAGADPIGNVYEGDRNKIVIDDSGDNKYRGAVAKNGKRISMYDIPYGEDFPNKFYKMGNYPKIIIHEVLHTLGLDDLGGKYYDPKGRMYYKAKPDNDFDMRDISTGDLQNIINYAIDNSSNSKAMPKVTIEEKGVSSSGNSIQNSNIKVQDKK